MMGTDILTWQERAEAIFKAETASLDQKKTETVMDAMRAEISDLRAALQAQQGEAKAPAPQCSVNDLLRVDDCTGRNPGLSSNT
jgi:hypothetical protein